MPRQPRNDIGNHIYHVINRANTRLQIFLDDSDYQLFEDTLFEGLKRSGIPLLAYSIMPNHFHLVLYPKLGGQLSMFMQWFGTTFTRRLHTKHRTIGTGHLYQGRYKAIRVESESYLLQVLLYVERNALAANLVPRAEDWRWSSLRIRQHGSEEQKEMLAPWPIEMPEKYLSLVNDLIE